MAAAAAGAAAGRAATAPPTEPPGTSGGGGGGAPITAACHFQGERAWAASVPVQGGSARETAGDWVARARLQFQRRTPPPPARPTHARAHTHTHSTGRLVSDGVRALKSQVMEFLNGYLHQHQLSLEEGEGVGGGCV